MNVKSNWDKLEAILKKVWINIQKDRISEGSAALAFYLTFATFPAIISLIAILPYLPIKGLEKSITRMITENIPGNAGIEIMKITSEVLTVRRPSLLSFGFIATLWFASSGMMAIINQLNVVFDVKEKRKIAKKRLVSLNLTLIYVTILILVSTTLIFGNKINNFIHEILGLSVYAKTTFAIIKFALGYVLCVFTFSSIYYFAPNKKMKFRFYSLGSAFASTVLILAGLIFNFYVAQFATYNEIYGSLGGIIVYMLWLYITGYILLVGAEIDTVAMKEKI